MKKAYVFGAGATARGILDKQNKYEICGFIDNDCQKWGSIGMDDLPIYNPKQISELEFDAIIIGSLSAYYLLIEQLKSIGIPEEKIDGSYIDADIYVKSRVIFMQRFAEMFCNLPNNINVAEAGVFQGEFAKEMNKAFPNRKLYLFDTFEGFDSRDIEYEKGDTDVYVKKNHLSTTSEELVLFKMVHSENCIVRRGFFPETVQGLEDEKFCFVNLDMDLYKPTYEGIKFFYQRMISGGCILIHDFFADHYPNVKKAVFDFESEMSFKLHKMPIGDSLSLAIIV